MAGDIKTPQLKVLIADDDPPTRMLLRAAISQWGYEVVEATNGEEGWDLLQKPDSPRLLILDWLMPKLDGVELCKRIKTGPEPHPYIILLTQVVGTANIVKGLEAGADEFLSKPFNMAELRSRLSVGAKIIGYEMALSQQNKNLTTDSPNLTEANIITMLKKFANDNGGNVNVETTDKGSRIVLEIPSTTNK